MCTSFISLLISINYLLLYAVVFVPIGMIVTAEEVETISVDGVMVYCEDRAEACEFQIEEDRVSFNNFVLMCNAGVLVYTMICECIVVCISLKPTNTKCSSYLACQVITGLSMRAVILISAQLIAVLIQDVNLINSTLGIVISSTLVLS